MSHLLTAELEHKETYLHSCKLEKMVNLTNGHKTTITTSTERG